MLCSITALIAFASIAAALPSGSIQSQTVKPTSTAAPPISPQAAKQIFEHNNLPSLPQVVPHLLDIHFTPRPTSTAAPPKPTAVGANPPSGSNIKQSTPPGIPKSGAIQVLPAEKIPLSSVLGFNQSHPVSHAPRELSPRQACQAYPYCCPDPRYLNENTAFPYNVIGRFASNVGSCTGTLVGPRHVLTAAHCISWQTCHVSVSGELQFLVDYWPGHEPAVFYGEAVHFYYASACGDPTTLVQEGIDYVVVILSEETGLPYMGLKAYNPAWNGPKYWYEQGYAADAGNTDYPYFQGPFEVVNQFGEGFGDILEYAACDTPGDSGSPVWGWWSDGPYIVGLMTEVGSQLGANAGWGPAGQAMVNLVAQAISLFP